MQAHCHRCLAELPVRLPGARANDDDARPLFCPACGAPQILLPDYMRVEAAANTVAVAESLTSGSMPPPIPQLLDWGAAIQAALPVAIACGIFSVAGLVLPAAAFLSTLCVLCGAAISLGLYRARRPLARIDGKVGLRVGLLTGLLIIAFIGLAYSVTGLVERFALHGMGSFDAQVAQMFATVRAQAVDTMRQQDQPLAVQQKALGYVGSPEVQAGFVLAYLALISGFVLVLTTVGGGAAGIFQTRRRALSSRD